MICFNLIIDEDEYDTWVNKKKSRYLYTYKLKSQSPDLFQNINDSDESESIHSTQSKATSNNFLKIFKLT